MEGDHAGGGGDALTETGELDAVGEGEVFEDLHAEGVEAAELLVGGGAEEVEGSDADGVAEGFGVFGEPGTAGPEAEDSKIAEEHAFAGGFDDGGGEGDEVVGLGGDGLSEGAADGLGGEEDVGVGEEEPGGLVEGDGVAGGEGHGVGFAEPAGGEFGDVEDAEFFRVEGGEGVEDGSGSVGGAVVDGEDVEVGVVLVDEGFEAGGDGGGFVAGGDDDGDGGAAGGGEVVLREEEVWDARQAAGGGDDLPEPGEGDEPCEELQCEL